MVDTGPLEPPPPGANGVAFVGARMEGAYCVGGTNGSGCSDVGNRVTVNTYTDAVACTALRTVKLGGSSRINARTIFPSVGEAMDVQSITSAISGPCGMDSTSVVVGNCVRVT